MDGFSREVESWWWGDRLFPDLDVEFGFLVAVEASHPLVISKALVFVPFHIALPFGFEDQAIEVFR